MTTPSFVLGEWLVCPQCGVICDAPFKSIGSDATEPELVLGASLPETEVAPEGEWRIEVTANCPACGTLLVASAVFEGRILREFAAVAT
jgi:rubredoxin